MRAAAKRAHALARSRGEDIGVATITFTDWVYHDAFDNWVHATTNVASTIPIVFALDNATYNFFASRDVLTLAIIDSRANSTGESSAAVANQLFGGALYVKCSMTRRLLDLRLRVIFSEMDVFWLADPLLLEDKSLDLQVPQQAYDVSPTNNGFFIAQPTSRARRFFSSLEQWAAKQIYGSGTPCLDQRVFDYSMRGELPTLARCFREVGAAFPRSANMTEAAIAIRGIAFFSQLTPQTSGASVTFSSAAMDDTEWLHWRYIPFELLPHPYKFNSGPQYPPYDMIAIGGAVAVHLWRTIGANPPAMRIACARYYGFWTLPDAQGDRGTPRIAPLLTQGDRWLSSAGEKPSLKSGTVLYRQAIVELLQRLSERDEELRATRQPAGRKAHSRISFRPAQRDYGLSVTAYDRNGRSKKGRASSGGMGKKYEYNATGFAARCAGNMRWWPPLEDSP